jgi:hypothetical protein
MQFLDVAFSGLAEYVLEHCQATQISQLRAHLLLSWDTLEALIPSETL